MSAVSAIVAEIAENREKLQKQEVVVAKAQDASRQAFRDLTTARQANEEVHGRLDDLTAALKTLGYELDDKGNPRRLA